MAFNPNKTTMVARWKVDRALFWFEVRLWLKITAVVLLPTAVAIWMLINYLDRMR